MKPNFSIKALADGEVEILLYDEIGSGWMGGIDLKEFNRQLRDAGKIDKITLRINSPGGDAFEGMAIYDLLIQQKADVAVVVDGLAASIASVIAMAGDKISMAENAFLMIHRPWAVSMGDAVELRKTAEVLDKIRGRIVATYAKRSQQDEATVGDMVDAESWMTAQEAVDLGFADEIVTGPMVAAHLDPEKWGARYKHIPAALAAKAAAPRVEVAAPSCDFRAMVRDWKKLQSSRNETSDRMLAGLRSNFKAKGFTIPDDLAERAMLERRICPQAGMRIEASESGPVLTGYAGVFNQLSSPLLGFRERVNPRAFEKTLAESPDVRSLINHDVNLILGRQSAKTLKVGTDEKGLWYAVNLPSTTYAEDLAKSIERGDVTQSSFSFRAVKDKWTVENGEEVRELLDVNLYDVGPVTFPAYTQTRVDIRSYAEFLEERESGSAAASAGAPEGFQPDPEWQSRQAILQSIRGGQ